MAGESDKREGGLQARDRLIFRWLGRFFLVFGILVWIGLFWPQSGEARLVNVISGAILAGVGIVGLKLGREPGA